MPFYEYECASCKFYKEVMQKVSDAPLRKCPSCGRNKLKKLVSAPVFRLKGAGWYETDFKSDKENKRNLAEKEPEPKDSTDAKGAKDASDAVVIVHGRNMRGSGRFPTRFLRLFISAEIRS